MEFGREQTLEPAGMFFRFLAAFLEVFSLKDFLGIEACPV
jgi:hypothetical protein